MSICTIVVIRGDFDLSGRSDIKWCPKINSLVHSWQREQNKSRNGYAITKPDCTNRQRCKILQTELSYKEMLLSVIQFYR